MKSPNIILINCDDLGYGDLGCYGSTQHATPHLDRMAAEGMRFTDFCMASSVCSPSRAALLTGCFPNRIGFGLPAGRHVLFPGDAEGLHPGEVTLAFLLKSQGYATQMVGKWHCGDQPEFLPTRHGFDHYYGLPYSNDMGRQSTDDNRPPLPLLRDLDVIEQQPDQASLTFRYVEESLRFIRQNKDGPFFLYFAHMYVHLPIYAPDRFLEESKGDAYAAGVAFIDWTAGVLMHELKSLGIDDNTLLVFTSDNGSRAMPPSGGSNAPLRGTKAQMWEGGFRVPGIFRWPGVIPPGRVCDTPAMSIDLYRTFAHFSGATIPPDRPPDGGTLCDILTGSPDSSVGRTTFPYYRGNRLCAVREGSWKLHLFGPKGEPMHELYHLGEDISESRNVHADHPDVVEQMEALAESYREELGDENTGRSGRNTRPAGRVAQPRPLTTYDPSHPYYAHEYDLDHRG
jgi:arylsulfatase A